MIRYAREVAYLLRGCGRSLAAGFGLCSASAAMDLVCMILLPLFLFATLTGSFAFASSQPAASLVTRWFPTYDSLVYTVIGAFLLRGALSLYVSARLTRLSEAIRTTLIRKLARHYLTSPYQQFTSRSVAWALTMVGAYTGTFAGSVALPLLRLLLDLMTMAAIFGFLMIIDHRVVGITVLTLTVVAVMYYLSVRRASERQSKRLSELQASLGQHLSRSLHSPREVRVFQLQSHFLSGIEDVLHKGADAQAKLTVIGSMPRVLGELTLIGLALGYLVYRTSGGVDSALMMSQLGLLGFAGLRLLPAFAMSLGNVAALRAGRHVTGLLAKELQSLPMLPPARASAKAGTPTPFESLELRGVSFAYAADRPVLEQVSLRINRGESVGVVGSSGTGKSTLGDLILGLLEPTGGEVLVNGSPARLGTESWWHTVGFVPQAVFLSNDTLLHNIAFGVPETAIDRGKVARAASMAQLDEVIRQLPQGLDSMIGDYGVMLSGGQRQRVAIARALYHERQFLVLDEATSALDTETEKAVVQAVASLRGSVTTFIIAHRRSTLDSCDVIVEVKEGRLTVVERAPGGAGAIASAAS
ncbi:MAG: ABC transporter ATP-binding protein [Pseudomonadota bacterium]